MTTKAQYLGDGVYCEVEHGMIKLMTWNGIQTTNTIYLEPEVVDALMQYLSRLKAQ
jgi:hypothetical protein